MNNIVCHLLFHLDSRISKYPKLLTNFLCIDKKYEIYHYSSKEHPKISKIATFGCEML